MQRAPQPKTIVSSRDIEDELLRRNKGSFLHEKPMRVRIALICRQASLRDDRKMARRPATNAQRPNETIRRMAREPDPTRSFSTQAELLCAGVVFLVALVVYRWTLAPTVTPTDSGELI